MRAAIYARYSSELQSETSIQDQARDCTLRIQRENWSLTKIYSDAAISGSTTLRPGYQDLLSDIRTKKFDIIVAEALDRLSRDQEDIAAFYKQIKFHGIRLITLSEGEINELHIGLKGTMNALFLKDLATKIKRGQRGNIENGRSSGGLSYGYKVQIEYDAKGMPIRGKRRVDDNEAIIINRIFTEYTNGNSPRAIAAGLNRDDIPAPKGGAWRASTINGNRARGNGILLNEAYIGFLIYNRTSMLKNPSTGKRVHKINPSEEWQIKEVPELKIVTNDLWVKVQFIKNSFVPIPTHKRRRPKRLLSGLIRCGTCGGSYTVIGENRFGCSAHRETGICENNRTISAAILEGRVLAGIKERLLAPDMLREFTKQVKSEIYELNNKQGKHRTTLNAEAMTTTKKIEKLVTAIEDGLFTPQLKIRIEKLEKRRQEIDSQLASLPKPSQIAILPNMPEMYRKQIENLSASLNANDTCRSEAIPILRSLIDKIVIHKRSGRGNVDIELFGSLSKIIGLAGGENANETDVMTMMVAEEGLEPPTRGL
jgi:site-specific DNA recombinase